MVDKIEAFIKFTYKAIEEKGRFQNIILICLWFFLIIMSLTISVRSPFPRFYFFADEATYYTMSYSLAYDHDLTYTKKDLSRVYQEWEGGPTGIFLKKGKKGNIYFGKSYLYSLFAAIPIKIFKSNGFFLLNTISFLLMVTLGTIFLHQTLPSSNNVFFSLFYFLFSTTWVFIFWIHPEILLMSLVMLAFFLWFSEPWKFRYGEVLRFGGIAFSLGLATFGKITNGIFILPILADSFINLLLKVKSNQADNRYSKKQVLLSIVVVLIIFLVTLSILFGINMLVTGDWNYQWGIRKGFAREFPMQDSAKSFDNLGSPATRHNLEINFNLILLLRNIFYFFFGRFGGIIPYFFPLIVVLFFLWKPFHNRKQTLLLISVGIQQLFFFIFLTDNYLGGMGTIGNRYFLNAFPACFFLISKKIPRYVLLLIVIIGSLFMAPLILNPFAQSYQPAEHTFSFPYNLLPIELTQIDFLPVNINHHLSRRYYDFKPPYRLTFFDYQTFLPEEGGFWLRPGKPAEILLETKAEISKMKILLSNGALTNKISLNIDGKKKNLAIKPWLKRTVELAVDYEYKHKQWYIHKLKLKAKKGFIPKFHDSHSTDIRFLGCFVKIILK